MVDDTSLERFLAAAAPLRGNPDIDPLRMFELLDAMRFDVGDALAGSLHHALQVSIVSATVPEARGAAIARYAFERLAFEIEGRLRSSGPADRRPVSRSSGCESRSISRGLNVHSVAFNARTCDDPSGSK